MIEAQNLPVPRTSDSTVSQVILEDAGIPILIDSPILRIYSHCEVFDVDPVYDRVVKNWVSIILNRVLFIRTPLVLVLSHRYPRSKYTAQAPRVKASKSPKSPTAAFASSARPSK